MENQIIAVIKEKGKTSRDIVNELCKVFNTKKVGHTGTLDPLATGVLIVCFNKYTKLVDLITSDNKEYIATVKLGILTDTLDVTGNVLKESACSVVKEDVIKALKFYTKTYIQEVPIYSAVKVNGRKLYDYARNGVAVELPKKEVTIYKSELLDFNEDSFTFKVLVSKGTYIRSLINDICNHLNVIGVMSDLVRTKQGKISIENSYTIEDIKNNNYKVCNLNEVLLYDTIVIDSKEYFLVKNGVKISKNVTDGLYFIKYNDVIICIYEFNNNVGKMKVYLENK